MPQYVWAVATRTGSDAGNEHHSVEDVTSRLAMLAADRRHQPALPDLWRSISTACQCLVTPAVGDGTFITPTLFLSSDTVGMRSGIRDIPRCSAPLLAMQCTPVMASCLAAGLGTDDAAALPACQENQIHLEHCFGIPRPKTSQPFRRYRVTIQSLEPIKYTPNLRPRSRSICLVRVGLVGVYSEKPHRNESSRVGSSPERVWLTEVHWYRGNIHDVARPDTEPRYHSLGANIRTYSLVLCPN